MIGFRWRDTVRWIGFALFCFFELIGVSPIVTASTLRDNKIDIHVSVTINTSASPLPLPPPSPPTPTALSVSAVSGVSCTLADLKKQRSQSHPCSLSKKSLALQNAFVFPCKVDGTSNEFNETSTSTSTSASSSAQLTAVQHRDNNVQSYSTFTSAPLLFFIIVI